MRLAVLIIGLCLTGILGLQSLAIVAGGNLAGKEAMAQGGAAGLLMAFMFVLGSAFVMNYPRASAIIFSLAAVVGFLTAGSSGFKDLQIWGILSLGLAIMSDFGRKQLIKMRSVATSEVKK